MSITTPDGGRIVTGARKRRIRKKEEVEERSRLAFELLCQGQDHDTVARLLRISGRHLYRLVARMPESLKRSIKRDVAREVRARLDDYRERLGADANG